MGPGEEDTMANITICQPLGTFLFLFSAGPQCCRTAGAAGGVISRLLGPSLCVGGRYGRSFHGNKTASTTCPCVVENAIAKPGSELYGSGHSNSSERGAYQTFP